MKSLTVGFRCFKDIELFKLKSKKNYCLFKYHDSLWMERQFDVNNIVILKDINYLKEDFFTFNSKDFPNVHFRSNNYEVVNIKKNMNMLAKRESVNVFLKRICNKKKEKSKNFVISSPFHRDKVAGVCVTQA